MPKIKLEAMTEREILIQQGGKLDSLCTALKNLTEFNTTEHTEIKGKVEKVTDNKVSNWLFFPIVTLIVFMIIGLTAYTGAVKNEVTKNTTARELNYPDHPR